MGSVKLLSVIAFLLVFMLAPFFEENITDSGNGTLQMIPAINESQLIENESNASGAWIDPQNETLLALEFNLTGNGTGAQNETALPELNLTENGTLPINEIISLDLNLTENESTTLEFNLSENETIFPSEIALLNETISLALNLTGNETNESSLDYEVISTDGEFTTIATGRGSEMQITDEALFLLESNETVRVIARADAFSTNPEGIDSIREVPSAGIKVMEVNQSDIATLADSGIDTLYIDAQMEASLSDSVPLIGADLARTELNYTGAGISVCLLDTGVDLNDPLLAGKVVSGYNFVGNNSNASDDGWHGTFMAHVINAIAPDATIISVKVLGANGVGYSSDIIAGIEFCRNYGASVISMSFGGGNYSEYCDSDPVAQAANAAVASGNLAVSSVGNKGAASITAPACGSSVIAVSSTSKQDTVSSFSNMNPLVGLLAPGEAITAGSQTRSGTSISAAHVSGAAALLLQSNTMLTPSETGLRFKETGVPIDFGGVNYSRINAYNAILNITNGNAPANETINTTNETGNYTYETQIEAPTTNTPTILPTNATEGTPLAGFCSANVSDATNLSYNYTWYLNGAANASGSASVGFATGGTITYVNESGVTYAVHTFTSSGTFNVTGALNVTVLVVAGGGGGGMFGGGGGAGGLIYNTSYNATGNITVIVGNGGAGDPTQASGLNGTPGQNSSFGTLVANGGGGGGSRTGSPWVAKPGTPGGSGGGGSPGDSGNYSGGVATPSGQGNNGGNGAANWQSGGGGGAGAAGGNATGSASGNGGAGLNYTINGTNTYYAGGGGGGAFSRTAGSGGSGGGGAGSSTGSGGNGTNGTGGGGGGSSYGAYSGGNGGSGIVIVRYASTVQNIGTIPASQLSPLQNWTLQCTAWNLNGSGSAVNSSVTTIGSICSTLGTAGATYTFAKNAAISGATCFNVTAANVTIDCGGYSITGNNSSGTYGIYSNSSGTIVKNCVVANFSTGIYFNGVSNGFVNNSSASTTQSSGYGIQISGGSGNNITGSNGSSTSQYGIYLQNTVLGKVTGSIANSSVNHGLYLSNASNCSFLSTTGINNGGGAFTYGGIYLASSSNFNNFTLCNATSSTNSLGFYLSASSYNNMTSLVVSAANTAVQLAGASNFNIFSNSIFNSNTNGYGLYVNANDNSFTNISTSGTIENVRVQAVSRVNLTNVTSYSSGKCAFYLVSSTNVSIQNSTANTTAGGWAGIYLSSATLTNITNTRAYSTSGSGIYITGANNTLTNVTATATAADGIWADSAANFTLINSTGIAQSGSKNGIYLRYSNNSYLSGSTGNSTSWGGIAVVGSSSGTITNSTGYSGSAWGLVFTTAGANNNLVANSTFITNSSTKGALQLGNGDASLNNVIYNNTLINPVGPLAYLEAGSGNNTFYWNNFTNTSSYYVTDLNGSNHYNASVGGRQEGNIWWNIQNGSLAVNGTTASSGFPTLYIGATGAGYPYNSTNAGGKLNGSGIADYAPLTPSAYSACGVYSTANSYNTLVGNGSINGSTCINVTAANVTIDCNGYSLTGNNTSNTWGIYSDQFNTTVKNCRISLFNVGVYFNGTDNGTVDNATINTTYSNGAGIYATNTANYNAFQNSSVYSLSGPGVSIDSSSTSNRIINLNATSYSGIGISLSSNSNSIIGSIGASTSSYGIYGYASYTTVNSSVGNSSSASGIYFTGAANWCDYNQVIGSQGISGASNGIEFNQYSRWNTIQGSNGTSNGNGHGIVFTDGRYAAGNITGSIGTSRGSGAGISYPISSGLIANSSGISNSGYGISFPLYSHNAQVINTSASSNSSSGIYINSGSNLTIDCQGASIVGTNASSTYGVYSAQFNTTVQNCNISNFSVGVYFNGADNGTIQNSTISTTYSGAASPYAPAIYLASTANFNTINGTTASSTSGRAIFVSSSNYNNISNSASSTASGTGTYVGSSNYNRISNFTSTSSSGNAFVLFSANNNSLYNVTTSGLYGIYVTISSTWNNISYSNASAGGGVGLFIESSANYNSIQNTLASSSSNPALKISGSSYNNITNTTIRSWCTNGALALESGSQNNTISNSTADAQTGTYAIYFSTGANTLNTFVNNTLLNATYLLSVSATSGANTFYWNNFTNIGNNSTNRPVYYATDANGTNHYNASVGGRQEGNIWANVENGSVAVNGTTASSGFSSLYIGAIGAGYPYNNSTAGGKLNGSIADYAPLTPYAYTACGIYSTANSYNSLIGNGTINGSTCITVSAENVTIDCNGYSITGNNSSSTNGILSTVFNTTVKNCIVSNFANGIHFNGATNGTIDNCTASTTQAAAGDYGRAIRIYSGANYNRIMNSAAAAPSGYGIDLQANFNQVINSTGASGSSYGIYLQSGNNTLLNATGASNTSHGIYLASSDNAINNSNGSNLVSGGSSHGVYFVSANRNQIANTSASSAAGSAFYINSGQNNTIDCQGLSIAGTNTSSTYGVYSSQFNTTVRNCNISNFATGIYFSGATNGTIENTNASTTMAYSLPSGVGILLYSGANYNTVSNCIANSSSRALEIYSSSYNTIAGTSANGSGIYGISLQSNSYFNTIVNSSGMSSGEGIYASQSANTTLLNSTGQSSGSYGIRIVNSADCNLTNVTAQSSTDRALGFETNSHRAIVTRPTLLPGTTSSDIGIAFAGGNNSTLDCQGASITGSNQSSSYGVYTNQFNTTVRNCGISNFTNALYLNNANNGTFYNNTFSPDNSRVNTLVVVAGSSSSNTFYWNNFTDTSGYYVQDLNGSNSYNSSVNGYPEGNVWHNVWNGSVNISGASPSGYGSDLWSGNTGSGYPYNNTSAAGKLSGAVVDYAPLTLVHPFYCQNLSAAGTTYTMNGSIYAAGMTCFNVTAENVTLDCNGYSMTGNNSSGTYGIYTSKFNSTIRNCNISNFATGIYFEGADNGTISNTTAATTRNHGIYLYNNAFYNTLSNVTGISSSYSGIILSWGGSYTTLSNITAISYSGIAFYFDYHSSSNSLSNAIVTSGTTNPAIRLYANSNNRLSNVTVASNTNYAILFSDSTNNTLSNVTATSNTSRAISIESTSFFNTINNSNASNLVSGATGYGIYIAGTSYNNQIINTSVSSAASSGIYIDSGANTSIDCQGLEVSGRNASSTYGVYSSQQNTTVANCNISNFSEGIRFVAATDSLVQNNTIAVTRNGGNAIRVTGLAHRNTFLQNTIIAGNASGIYVDGGNNTSIDCLGAAINGSEYAGTYGVYSTERNTSLSNCTISNFTNAVRLAGATNSTFFQNTFYSSNNTHVFLNGSASGNTFYLNNFTDTSALYANDSNGGNFWNASYAGKSQGNMWWNAVNASLDFSGSVSYSLGSYYIGTSGAAYPYNSTTSLGKVAGLTDYAPAITLARTTYQFATYYGAAPAMYFANGSTVNISTSSSFASAPALEIRDSTGALQSSGTMNGSGPYEYLYVINGSSGYYNATVISSSNSSYPYLFYASAPWQANFTNASGTLFSYRRALNLTEPGSVARRRQAVEFPVSFTTAAGNGSVRVVALQGGQQIEIPSQLYNITYSGAKMASASIAFIDDFGSGQARQYYVYYSYAAKSNASYPSDLSLAANGTFENANMQGTLNATYGGTLTSLYSKYSNFTLTSAAAPTTAPEINLYGLLFRAYNSSSTSPSLSSGTVFSKYYANGSYLFLTYNLTYTFYAGTGYFVLESNITTPLFTQGVPINATDAGILFSQERLSSLNYNNGSNVTASLGANFSFIPNLKYISLYSTPQRSGVSLIPLENTSTDGLNPMGFARNESGYYHLQRQLFNGSANGSSWFYSKSAYLIFDPSSGDPANDAYLAFANPLTRAIGSQEAASVPVPNYTSGYSPASPYDTSNLTFHSYWQSQIDLDHAEVNLSTANYSTAYNQSLSGNSSFVNITINSSVLQAGNASVNITVYDAVGQPNSTAMWVAVGDLKAPVATSVTYSPNTSAELDPGVNISVRFNMSEFTAMGTALLQYNSSANSTLGNVTPTLLSNGTHWFHYEANFTPASEANYSFRIYANDTLGNENYSSFTTVEVAYDRSWTLSPSTFAAAALFGENASLVNLTLNATGDYGLSVRLNSNFDYNKVYYNGTVEGVGGYTIALAAGSPVTIEASATAKTQPGSDTVVITGTALNGSSSPSSATSNGSFISYSGGAYLYNSFTTIPVAVTKGDTGVSLIAKAQNLGNETASSVTYSWTLPSDWVVTSGSTSGGAGDLSATGGSYSSSIAVSIPSTAASGSQSVSFYTTCAENKSSTATATVQVMNSTPGPSPTPTPSGGGGGGGGGNAPKGNYTNATKPAPPKVEKNLTKQQKQKLFDTSETFEIVRGRDASFPLTISNPLDSDLRNITISASGYLSQYIRISPTYIESIAPGASSNVTVWIEAPKYFAEGDFSIIFTISGVSVTQTEDAIITTDVSEKRTVDLRILEMSRDDAKKLMAEAGRIRTSLENENAFHGEIAQLYDSAKFSYDSDKFGDLKANVEKMRGLSKDALAGIDKLKEFKDKLAAAEADFKLTQSSRLYNLASLAFERGDYATGMQRLQEAELTYQLETTQSFSLAAFAKKYAMQIALGIALMLFASTLIYVDVRFWMMDNELTQLKNEEEIVIGLIKETQDEYFQAGKLSTEEYTESVHQYEGRLGKIVERRVELETQKKNYFNFKGGRFRLESERDRLNELIGELQKDYLEKGKVETHVYENRMKSYVTRLSEVEGAIAVAEADEEMKKGQGLSGMFPKAGQGGAEKPSGAAQQKPPGAQGKAPEAAAQQKMAGEPGGARQQKPAQKGKPQKGGNSA